MTIRKIESCPPRGYVDGPQTWASGGFLAEILNRQTAAEHYDYLDFYMETIWVAQRADLTPVYQMVFRRFQGRRLDWIYHFP